MSIASVLPFLAQLKQQQGIDPNAVLATPQDAGSPGGQPPPQQSSIPIAPDNQPAPIPDTPTDMGSLNTPTPKKGHFLLELLHSGLQGALSGLAANAQTYAQTGRNAGFGGGLAGSLTFPLGIQREQLQNQSIAAVLPFLQQAQLAGIQEKTSAAQKNIAEAGKAGAETQAIPVKTQLEQAQALAANYKDDPNLGLIDLRTGQPVGGNIGTAPLTAQEAAILGKQPGESVPLKIKNTANEMVNRGIRSVSAGGRQLLVDGQGNTIKDLGQATPMAVINAQTGAFGNPASPEVQAIVDSVGQGKMDLPTALGSMRRNPAAAASFMGALLSKYPDYQQQNFGVSKKTMEYFTTGQGGNELNAFRTAIAHAELLKQAAQALNNNDSRTLSGLQNRLMTEFGDPRLTTFQAIANAYNHEVTAAISKGHITDKEVGAGDATMPPNANFETILSVANAYQGLMASKAQQRMIQYEQGIQGKPAFPQGIQNQSGPPAGATMKVPGSDGKMHWSDGKQDLGIAQ